MTGGLSETQDVAIDLATAGSWLSATHESDIEWPVGAAGLGATDKFAIEEAVGIAGLSATHDVASEAVAGAEDGALATCSGCPVASARTAEISRASERFEVWNACQTRL